MRDRVPIPVEGHSPLRVTPSGFVSEASPEPHTYAWNDIIEIRAFKVDLFAVDEVRFALSFRDGTAVEVSEEQPGFSAFIDALKAQFPGVAGWEHRVIQPAFATNSTVLYRGA